MLYCLYRELGKYKRGKNHEYASHHRIGHRRARRHTAAGAGIPEGAAGHGLHHLRPRPPAHPDRPRGLAHTVSGARGQAVAERHAGRRQDQRGRADKRVHQRARGRRGEHQGLVRSGAAQARGRIAAGDEAAAAHRHGHAGARGQHARNRRFGRPEGNGSGPPGRRQEDH